jgi:hypothetical protein
MKKEIVKNSRDVSVKEDQPKSVAQKDVGKGLTDDERVSREDDPKEEGARVELGPADLERLSKN